MKTTAFCITGWHYPPEFYQMLSGLSSVDIYIVSHQKRSVMPSFIFDLFAKDQILIRSNIGYDWGCYQQFISSDLWRQHEILFFMHDDIKIHNFNFMEETEKLLKDFAVVGNGRGKGGVSFAGVRSHPYAYAHSSWKPDSYDFQHQTVRGSFFATTRAALEELRSFEVYWDPFKIFIGFGNWSTKASCGKMEATFGPDCFGYFSETFGSSDYIKEFVRGEEGGDINQPEGLKLKIYEIIKRVSRVFLEISFREREVKAHSGWLLVMKPFLKLFSGKLY